MCEKEKVKMKPFTVCRTVELRTTTSYEVILWAETAEQALEAAEDIDTLDMDETDKDSDLEDEETEVKDSDTLEPDDNEHFVAVDGEAIIISDAEIEVIPPSRWWELDPIKVAEHNGQKSLTFKERK
jgi:hypothetical protein